jgi:hypothetical protein
MNQGRSCPCHACCGIQVEQGVKVVTNANEGQKLMILPPHVQEHIVPSPQVRILKNLIDQMNDICKFVRDLKKAF